MNLVLPKSGRYVAAVSGGVDSIALLDILHKEPGLELLVAHFDHGIRQDSNQDRQLVEKTAKGYGLPFYFEEGGLGSGASEAKARQARYSFLRKTLKDTGSKAIITAHHQDDVLETAIINILRGTGRKGLTALKDQADIARPLLKVPKQALVDYCKHNNLEWREDPTNLDTAYLRNYVRHKLLPRFNDSDRAKMIAILTKTKLTNREIDDLLGFAQQDTLGRQWFINLPHQVAREVLAGWLRANNVRDFNKKSLERLVIAAKTAETGKQIDVLGGTTMAVNQADLALHGIER